MLGSLRALFAGFGSTFALGFVDSYSMSVPIVVTDRLDALVSGKRRSPRRAVALPVRIKGAHGEFAAVTVDVSRDGALLRMQETELTGEGRGPLDAAEQFALTERHFRETFDIEFTEELVVVEAQLMRLCLGANDVGTLGLGCRFVYPLGTRRRTALGLTDMDEDDDAQGDWEVAARLHDLRMRPRGTRPITALLFDDVGAVSGPVHLGRVVEAGQQALVVRLDGVEWVDVAQDIPGEDLLVCLQRGTRGILDARAHCVAVRYADGPKPGAEILLELTAKLPWGVRRFFGRA